MKAELLHRSFVLSLLLFVLTAPLQSLRAQVQRVGFEGHGNYLLIEVLDDDLVHFEYGHGALPGTDTPIATSDMVCKPDGGLPAPVCPAAFDGAKAFSDQGHGVVETSDLRLNVDTTTLAVSVFDRTKNNVLLTTLRAENLDQDWKSLVGTRGPNLDVYGLGQQFVNPGSTDIDWDGRVREGDAFGNVMAGFNGGADGNTQFPVMYAVDGASFNNYALFLDNKYKQRWDFTSPSQWKVDMARGALRFYLMSGPDLLDLRKDFMELAGHPLVPPRKMFGLWVSEYGYDDWGELEDKLRTLRENNFPLDGFVLDLQWFGGINPGSDDTRMGTLTFDPVHFPDAPAKIAAYRDQDCLGIMLIEEAYVGRALPEHADLAGRGCLVPDHPGGTSPDYITVNPWWGKGGMIDYTSDACGAYWHDTKRQPLIDLGVIGHWTDLGEPEMFNPGSGFSLGDHADGHNVFNLRWLRSINAGYARNGVEQRPFMMSRSGTAGIQRFGAAMWSGDIGSKLDNLDSHAANQKHMSFSGIDYYGSDIGGFHRGDIQNDPQRKNRMYTEWLAASSLLDIPARPHTENLCNCKQTAPDRIGDLGSNLENVRLRYRLIPYLYSLAHRAYLEGEPLMPPLAMRYQDDPNVRNRGQEKLIGRELLTAVTAGQNIDRGDVYLPAGTWIDWYSNERVTSPGMLRPVPLYRDGLFRLPLFARAGALIPMAVVDEQTMCSQGRRKDGSRRDDLVVKVFDFGPEVGQQRSFTLYEDDGRTIAYQQGAVRTTGLTNTVLAPESGSEETHRVRVEIAPAQGTYAGAPDSRVNLVRLVTDGHALGASLNGQPLAPQTNLAAFDAAPSGWIGLGNGEVLAKSAPMAVADAKTFVIQIGEPTCTSTNQYVAVPGAGNGWNPADPDRRLTSCEGRVWSGEITLCNEEHKFAANGGWAVNWGCDGKQDGANCPPREPGIYRVSFDETAPASSVFERIGEAAACAGGSSLFVCENGDTSWGTSVYVVGNRERLGNWDPKHAQILVADGPYPKWTGYIDDLPADGDIEWKCIKRLEGADRRVIQWEPGPNNRFDPASAAQIGDFHGN